MKTTLELPDELMSEVKIRAVHEHKKLKDIIAELLRKGLAATANSLPESPAVHVSTDKKTRLPLIKCKHPASASEEITPERAAYLLLSQEVGWQHAARG